MKTKDRDVPMPVRDRKVSEQGDQSFPQEGVWPRVNRELIKDYPRQLGSEFRGVFRIHLDVPISERTFKRLETAFETGNLVAARDVLRERTGNALPGTDEHQAWMTIEAALSP